MAVLDDWQVIFNEAIHLCKLFELSHGLRFLAARRIRQKARLFLLVTVSKVTKR